MIETNMKNLAVVSIIVLFGVFAFGAVDLALFGHGEHGASCIVSPLIQEDCSMLASGVEFAILHLKVLKNFSETIFNSSGFLTLLVLTLTVIAFGLLSFLASGIIKKIFSNFSQKINQLKSYFQAHHKFISWLSFLEHSPTRI